MSIARYISKLGTLLNSNGQVLAAGHADGSVTAAKLASGAARSNFGAGAVLQVVQTVKKDVLSSTATGWTDIPSLSASITPTLSTSKILAIVNVNGGGQSATTHVQLRLLRDATEIGSGNADGTSTPCFGFLPTFASGDVLYNASTDVLDSPSTTSALTYKVQFRNNNSSGTIYINRSQSSNTAGCPLGASSITLLEIAA